MITDKFKLYREAIENNAPIYVFDVETTLIPKGKGESMYKTPPKLVMWDGHSLSSGKFYSEINATKFLSDYELYDYLINTLPKGNLDILVGHSVTYDIFIGLTCTGKKDASLPRHTVLWDTMLAAYLLSNQELRSPSLNETAEYFGISGRKDDEVSQMIKSGICPSIIDRDKLKTYLDQDILLTKDVFLKQRERFLAKPKQWQNMFINQMLFLANTFRASYNGIKIDNNFVNEQKAALNDRQGQLYDELIAFMAGFTAIDKTFWNPSSNDDLRIVLYGGIKTVERRVVVGVYKTGAKAGQNRYKIEKNHFDIYGMFQGLNLRDEEKTVDESKIKQLKTVCKWFSYTQFLDNILEYRDITKNLGTYYEGYMSYADSDGFIHPQYHHTRTPTGRLTCTNPNLQNIKS
jgi:DNA polymerase I-like protein with 3'-5' exonuclease and polymerase domains